MLRLYIGKNALNQVRQMNGYLEGSYIKEWFDKEDNVHMMHIINQMDVNDVSFEELVGTLDDIYKTEISVNRSL
jgi:hypothetical protein